MDKTETYCEACTQCVFVSSCDKLCKLQFKLQVLFTFKA